MFTIHNINIQNNTLTAILCETGGFGLFSVPTNLEFGNEILKRVGLKTQCNDLTMSPIRCYYHSDYPDSEELWEDQWSIHWKC